LPAGVLLEVDTVSAAMTGLVPLIVTDDGLMEQVGAGTPPPTTLHDRPMVPL
jgi:hypothetical protein